MKIAILTLGTRGDVQPYATLGLALQNKGHEIVLSTAKNFENLISAYNLSFEPVDADFEALLYSEEGKKIRKNPFLAKKYLAKFVYPMMRDSLSVFYRLARQNDCILFHIKTMADVFADQFPHKMIRADIIPARQPTKEFPNPVFSFLPLPSFMNKLTYKITELGLKMWKKPVVEFREAAGLSRQFKTQSLPSLYGISELYLKKPADYPPESYFTGFWSQSYTAELNKDILDFIAAGAPPLLITFGSMPFDSKLDFQMLIRTLSKKLSIRIILVKGWGIKHVEILQEDTNIKVIDSAPYNKLFPLVKAVVHHGGIGTITACLEAGKPFLSCPVIYPMGDQYFWSHIGYKKGVALKPLPLKKITQRMFIENCIALLNDEKLYTNAQALAASLASENGVENAISRIGKIMHAAKY